mmetsp:Transcript_7270/g.10913  ORF Transcript_7270/g.10913 Transcript_7270/m.10913 type:complete len:458 (-) Transcript_7270:2045-3418(-)
MQQDFQPVMILLPDSICSFCILGIFHSAPQNILVYLDQARLVDVGQPGARLGLDGDHLPVLYDDVQLRRNLLHFTGLHQSDRLLCQGCKAPVHHILHDGQGHVLVQIVPIQQLLDLLSALLPDALLNDGSNLHGKHSLAVHQLDAQLLELNARGDDALADLVAALGRVLLDNEVLHPLPQNLRAGVQHQLLKLILVHLELRLEVGQEGNVLGLQSGLHGCHHGLGHHPVNDCSSNVCLHVLQLLGSETKDVSQLLLCHFEDGGVALLVDEGGDQEVLHHGVARALLHQLLHCEGELEDLLGLHLPRDGALPLVDGLLRELVLVKEVHQGQGIGHHVALRLHAQHTLSFDADIAAIVGLVPLSQLLPGESGHLVGVDHGLHEGPHALRGCVEVGFLGGGGAEPHALSELVQGGDELLGQDAGGAHGVRHNLLVHRLSRVVVQLLQHVLVQVEEPAHLI